MAVTWTEKAEAEYRAKHPDSPCKRIAGQVVMYDDKELIPAGSIYQAYAMRGWVQNDGKKVITAPEGKSKNFTPPNTAMPFEDQLRRWAKIQRLCRENPNITVKEIAAKLGLKNRNSITQFCTKYGKDLVKRLGKLPRMQGINYQKNIWPEIMEK